MRVRLYLILIWVWYKPFIYDNLNAYSTKTLLKKPLLITKQHEFLSDTYRDINKLQILTNQNASPNETTWPYRPIRTSRTEPKGNLFATTWGSWQPQREAPTLIRWPVAELTGSGRTRNQSRVLTVGYVKFEIQIKKWITTSN